MSLDSAGEPIVGGTAADPSWVAQLNTAGEVLGVVALPAGIVAGVGACVGSGDGSTDGAFVVVGTSAEGWVAEFGRVGGAATPAQATWRTGVGLPNSTSTAVCAGPGSGYWVARYAPSGDGDTFAWLVHLSGAGDLTP